MIVRSFDNSKDYSDVVGWWTKHEWQILPLDFLSSNGYIAELEDKKVAATWVYATNSPIYIMEWTVSNPEVEWETRAKGVNLVMDAACNWAKNNGAKHIVTMSNHNRFITKLEEFGFKKTDLNMTHLVRSL